MVKDVVGVYARLFDHRAFLQNETKIFVREFEGKRSDREVARLVESKLKLDQMKETLPRCLEHSQRLAEVQEHLKEARQLCHGILVREDEEPNKAKREEMLRKTREEWEEFQKEVEESRKQIEKRYQERTQQMKDEYGVET